MTQAHLRLLGIISCVVSLALNLGPAGSWQERACAAGVSEKVLESEKPQLAKAVDLISKRPRAAEKILERLHSPSAKMYLAYLYISGKIARSDKSKRVDTLMHQAAVEAYPTGPNLNVANEEVIELQSKHPHYSGMSEFFYDFRTISDFGNSGSVLPPIWLFKEHPVEAFAAFDPRFGSSLDYGIDLKLPGQDDVTTRPAVSNLLATLRELCGSLSGSCEGTIRCMFACYQQVAILEASLAPEVFLAQPQDNRLGFKTRQAVDAELNLFMEAWSNQQLWNKQKYREWLLRKEKAVRELAAFYVKRLKLEPRKAMICAQAAVNGVSFAYLGSHEHAVIEKANSRVYQIFSRPQLTRQKMDELLAGKPLVAEELPDALRLAILNQAELAVIDYLLKQAAPVTGGSEPPLFTAVLRPDVEQVLVKAGANVNEINPIGKSPLIQAAQYNALESMKILVAAGADVNHPMIAVDSEEAKQLGCEYNYTIGSRTPLMYAAWFAGYPAINYLLDRGANQAALDSDGANALKYLGKNKQISEIEKVNLRKRL